MYKWIKAFFVYPIYMIQYIFERLGLFFMNDKSAIRLLYYAKWGKKLDLDNPKTYVEKVNYLKLHDRNPLYHDLVDKYEVKKIVASLIGEKYIIKLLGVWNLFDDIDFQSLPQNYVLKCTHDSGGVLIVNKKIDLADAKKFINNHLNRNHAEAGREWAYRTIKPRIIAEEYIEGLSDNNYKFFCFNGKVKYLYVAPFREKTVDYFDDKFNHLNIVTTLHQCADIPPKKPSSFDEMIKLAEILSKGIPHVRIDFYDVKGRVYFGEVTFYHEAGFEPYIPDEYNYKFGNYIDLSLAYDANNI